MTDNACPIILLTGDNGQVGFALKRSLQGLGRVVGVGRQTLDLTNQAQIRSVVRDVAPSIIVNAAAYTAVDRAETEHVLARSINAEAPAILAEEARRIGAAIVHYSTDYVFDGELERPYIETDPANPVNAYGHGKLEGEAAVSQVDGDYLILRTSWVYGLRGTNFLRTMLRLGRDRGTLSVVNDQFGAPTWSGTIAAMTAHVLAQVPRAADLRDAWWREKKGCYHLTAGGSTSWYGFAQAIFDEAALPERPIVSPVPAASYPAVARRPANSRLSTSRFEETFGLHVPDWRDVLGMVMEEARETRPDGLSGRD
ncbi:dTDP-4-dehydrorhamnose reductase [Burkholderia sp. BCC0405]|uniref:dTDP-4-dehydrorhamnose reductase n=1 Tax=Burkholderia sp. BCC0405 TaxID=2676298 RepID=UPI00158DF55B|nr:dTDP-4-dehydrorhamnose reductase [Burkholderia sp. BCC0405]